MTIMLIDAGTTTSRIRLVDETRLDVIDFIKLDTGVRQTAIDGSNSQLKRQLAYGVEKLLNQNQMEARHVRYIVASGMITSNLGIQEISHVQAPANLNDFAEHAAFLELEIFLNIPALFVPGMTNLEDSFSNERNDLESVNAYDVMRGEEVEAYGLLRQLKPRGKGILILPGSHMKFVLVDQDQMLLSCFSTLSGEILKAIQSQTILADSISGELIETVLPDYLMKGYQAAQDMGVTRSLYHTRLFDLFSDLNANERANYYAGAVLHEDVKALENILAKENDVDWLIVGGSNPLRSAVISLMNQLFESYRLIEASNQQVDMAAVYGASDIGDYYFGEAKQ